MSITESGSKLYRSVQTTLKNLIVNVSSIHVRKRLKSSDEWLDAIHNGQQYSPYASDGADLLDFPTPMLSYYYIVDSAADGAIASTTFLPAYTGGKIVVYEMSITGGVIAAPATPASFTGVILGDGIAGNLQHLGGMITTKFYGPVKQATSSTEITISAAAGACTASARFAFSIRYRTIPD